MSIGVPTLGLGINAMRFRGGAAPSDPGNLLFGLPWIAGADTTLSVTNGGLRTRGTAGSAATNPRFWKDITVISGHTYSLVGDTYPEVGGNQGFFRISVDDQLQNPLYTANVIWSGTTHIDGSWLSDVTGTVHVGIVSIADVDHLFIEIANNFAVRDIT